MTVPATDTAARDRPKGTAGGTGPGSNEQGSGLLDVATAPGQDASEDGTGDGTNCWRAPADRGTDTGTHLDRHSSAGGTARQRTLPAGHGRRPSGFRTAFVSGSSA